MKFHDCGKPQNFITLFIKHSIIYVSYFKCLLWRNTRHLVFSSVVSLTWTDPSTQGTYRLEIRMLWIRRLSPIDKHPMYMLDQFSVFMARFTDISNSKEYGQPQCSKINTTSVRLIQKMFDGNIPREKNFKCYIFTI